MELGVLRNMLLILVLAQGERLQTARGFRPASGLMSRKPMTAATELWRLILIGLARFRLRFGKRLQGSKAQPDCPIIDQFGRRRSLSMEQSLVRQLYGRNE